MRATATPSGRLDQPAPGMPPTRPPQPTHWAIDSADGWNDGKIVVPDMPLAVEG